MSTQAAAEIGREYARLGRPITECPYDANGDGEQQAFALRFIRGYSEVRPAEQVDYDENLAD